MIHKGPTEAHNEGENGTQLNSTPLRPEEGMRSPDIGGWRSLKSAGLHLSIHTALLGITKGE